MVYHRGVNGGVNPADYGLRLNDTNAQTDNSTYFNDTLPTSTHFTIGTNSQVNADGSNYVAYVFAGGESNAATARSVDFDGGEGLDLAATSGASLGTGTFCVECWVYLDDAPGSGSPSYARIFQLDGPTGNSAGENLQITIEPGGCRLYVQSGSSYLT